MAQSHVAHRILQHALEDASLLECCPLHTQRGGAVASCCHNSNSFTVTKATWGSSPPPWPHHMHSVHSEQANFISEVVLRLLTTRTTPHCPLCDDACQDEHMLLEHLLAFHFDRLQLTADIVSRMVVLLAKSGKCPFSCGTSTCTSPTAPAHGRPHYLKLHLARCLDLAGLVLSHSSTAQPAPARPGLFFCPLGRAGMPHAACGAKLLTQQQLGCHMLQVHLSTLLAEILNRQAPCQLARPQTQLNTLPPPVPRVAGNSSPRSSTPTRSVPRTHVSGLSASSFSPRDPRQPYYSPLSSSSAKYNLRSQPLARTPPTPSVFKHTHTTPLSLARTPPTPIVFKQLWGIKSHPLSPPGGDVPASGPASSGAASPRCMYIRAQGPDSSPVSPSGLDIYTPGPRPGPDLRAQRPVSRAAASTYGVDLPAPGPGSSGAGDPSALVRQRVSGDSDTVLFDSHSQTISGAGYPPVLVCEGVSGDSGTRESDSHSQTITRPADHSHSFAESHVWLRGSLPRSHTQMLLLGDGQGEDEMVDINDEETEDYLRLAQREQSLFQVGESSINFQAHPLWLTEDGDLPTDAEVLQWLANSASYIGRAADADEPTSPSVSTAGSTTPLQSAFRLLQQHTAGSATTPLRSAVQTMQHHSGAATALQSAFQLILSCSDAGGIGLEMQPGGAAGLEEGSQCSASDQSSCPLRGAPISPGHSLKKDAQLPPDVEAGQSLAELSLPETAPTQSGAAQPWPIVETAFKLTECIQIQTPHQLSSTDTVLESTFLLSSSDAGDWETDSLSHAPHQLSLTASGNIEVIHLCNMAAARALLASMALDSKLRIREGAHTGKALASNITTEGLGLPAPSPAPMPARVPLPTLAPDAASLVPGFTPEPAPAAVPVPMPVPMPTPAPSLAAPVSAPVPAPAWLILTTPKQQHPPPTRHRK